MNGNGSISSGGSGDSTNGLASLDAVAATNAAAMQGVTTASNSILSGFSVTNDAVPFYTFGNDTNTLSVIQPKEQQNGFNALFHWYASGFYSNDISTALSNRVIKLDGSSSRFLLALNAAQTRWATNLTALNTPLGEYRSNPTLGNYWFVTTAATPITNIVSARMYRSGVKVSADEWGARGDGLALYGITISNSVVTAPGQFLTDYYNGKSFWLYTDTTNLNYAEGYVSQVTSSNTFTVSDNLKSLNMVTLGRTNLYGMIGTDNQPAVSNALWNSMLAIAGGECILGKGPTNFYTGKYLFGKAFITADGTNAAVINLPEPLLYRNWFANSFQPTNRAVSITIRGAESPILYPQSAMNTGDTVGSDWSGITLYSLARPVIQNRTHFIYHAANYFNSAEYGGQPAQSFDDFGWNRYQFYDLTIRTAPNSINGVWFEWGGGPRMENCRVDTDRPQNDWNVANAKPKVYLSNIAPGFFSSDTNITTNVFTVVNVTNVTGMPVGVRLPRAWNYGGSQMKNCYIGGYGVGLWMTEHLVSENVHTDCNTIGRFLEGQDYHEGYYRFSFSPATEVRPVTYQNVFPMVVSTNGTRHYYAAFAPTFENEALGFGTKAITDPLKLLAGDMVAVNGTDQLLNDSTNLAYGSIQYAIQDFGGRRITNAYIHAGQLTGVVSVPVSGNVTNISVVTSNLVASSATVTSNLNVTGSLTTSGTNTFTGTQNLATNTTSFPVNVSLNGGGGNATNFGVIFVANLRSPQNGTLTLTASDGTAAWKVDNSSASLFAGSDGAWNIGAIAGNRPQDIFAKRAVVASNFVATYMQPHTNGFGGQGGILGCNGTNWWTVMRDSGGVLTTNKISLTTWP